MSPLKISQLINGKITCEGNLKKQYDICFASDLMSDVLRIDTEKLFLLTGLANTQSIRTAEMADIDCVILARNKKASHDMIELAKDANITIVECTYSMFHIAGILYNNGIKPLF